jgi:purine-binding chemotaxis protein CheW
MRTRRTSTRQRHDPSKNFVGFLVGDVMYGIRIEVVREIVNPLEVVALPRAPASMRGVADYRGLVVPVLDLRQRFGLEPAESRRTKWIVIDAARTGIRDASTPSPTAPMHAALIVDSVLDVFGTGGSEVRPSPALGAGDRVRGIEGVTSYGEKLVFVLDAHAFARIAQEALSAPPPPLGASEARGPGDAR